MCYQTHADAIASSTDGARATSWTRIVANGGSRGRGRGQDRGRGGSHSPRAESAPPVTGDVSGDMVSELLRRLSEMQQEARHRDEEARQRDGVVQQLQLRLDDVMAGAVTTGPSRRRGGNETDPVVVGTATTTLSPPGAQRASEDDDVTATNTKEDLKLWRNSQYAKRWYLTGQRALEPTMTLVNMKMRLRQVAAVDQKVLHMLNNLGAFDVRAMKAPNDAASASIDLPERLAIFIDALMAVVSRGVCGAVYDARLDVAAVDQKVLHMLNNLGAFDVRAMKAPNDAASASIDLPERLAIFIDALMAVVSRGVCGAVYDARLDVWQGGLEKGASALRKHATAHRSTLRHPANYEVLADILNDDLNDWASDCSDHALAIMREFQAPPRADEFPDVLVPSWSHLTTYISVGGLRTSRHFVQQRSSGGGGGASSNRTPSGKWGYCRDWATPQGCSRPNCKFEHAHDPDLPSGARSQAGGGAHGRGNRGGGGSGRANGGARAASSNGGGDAGGIGSGGGGTSGGSGGNNGGYGGGASRN
eukprot:g11328.t1